MKRSILLIVILLTSTLVLGQTKNPRTIDEFNKRALERQSQGDFDGAIEDYTKAIQLKPKALDLAAVYYNRANARLS